MEIGRYLTEKTRLACVPQVAGALAYRGQDGDDYTLAVLHEYVSNEGDAWIYTLDELGRYLERIESELSGSPPADALPTGVSLTQTGGSRFRPTSAQETIGSYLQSAELLGTRTAEMHLALAAGQTRLLRRRAFHETVSAQRLSIDACPGPQDARPCCGKRVDGSTRTGRRTGRADCCRTKRR